MYIAIDFDGTLVENAFPAVGKEVPLAVETVKYLISKGNKIILHTCRTHDNHDGHDCLAEAEQWCRDRGIELYAVNDNPENRKYWGAQDKIDKVNYPSPKVEWASSFNDRDLAFFLLEYLPAVLFSTCIVFLCSVGI